MEIVKVKINDLKFADYNPRKWSEKAKNDLKESIKRFGLVDPIIVNSNPARLNIIIGGHFRVYIARELGYSEVPVVYVNREDINKEKELNIRLNKNQGEFDYELLKDFSEEMLIDVGFESEELMEMFSLNEIESVEVDMKRLTVITIEAPEAPKLKERMAFYCSDINEYKRIIEYFKKGRSDLNKDKLLELL